MQQLHGTRHREENLKTIVEILIIYANHSIVTRTKITCKRTSLRYDFTDVYGSIRLHKIWELHAHYHLCNGYQAAPELIREKAAWGRGYATTGMGGTQNPQGHTLSMEGDHQMCTPHNDTSLMGGVAPPHQCTGPIICGGRGVPANSDL